jgi:hypothetical protein
MAVLVFLQVFSSFLLSTYEFNGSIRFGIFIACHLSSTVILWCDQMKNLNRPIFKFSFKWGTSLLRSLKELVELNFVGYLFYKFVAVFHFYVKYWLTKNSKKGCLTLKNGKFLPKRSQMVIFFSFHPGHVTQYRITW